ncbi:hypothetical protein VNO77_41660 [Canavalia gladiata]|uniref:Uncharacterized protein n=1 Tax=Canavalia gladiata TaxID=3824 RepID=A0AAN9K1A7_CANGL
MKRSLLNLTEPMLMLMLQIWFLEELRVPNPISDYPVTAWGEEYPVLTSPRICLFCMTQDKDPGPVLLGVLMAEQ